MSKDTNTSTSDIKIIVPIEAYRHESDKRLLIPYVESGKIGFTSPKGTIIVKPRYDVYYGDCYSESDYIKVGINTSVRTSVVPIYGLIDYQGKEILPMGYYTILCSDTVFTVRDVRYQYAVVNGSGDEIVPAGKYTWISDFYHGLARVTSNTQMTDGTDKKLWGIINDKGEEVLPVTYTAIWNFSGKSVKWLHVEKENRVEYVEMNALLGIPQTYRRPYHNYDYGNEYDDYNGSYAQDVAGYSDDVISDAFEDDPDAYWNID